MCELDPPSGEFHGQTFSLSYLQLSAISVKALVAIAAEILPAAEHVCGLSPRGTWIHLWACASIAPTSSQPGIYRFTGHRRFLSGAFGFPVKPVQSSSESLHQCTYCVFLRTLYLFQQALH